MNKRRLQPKRTGFFITAFDDRSNFVYQALRSQEDKAEARIVRLDAGTDSDMLGQLTKLLRECTFVVVDVSCDRGSFNPNVMVELGRALELRKPVFSISDASAFRHDGGLPFDIHALKTLLYNFTPPGLLSLAKSFGVWLNDKEISRYELAHKHIFDLVELWDHFDSWMSLPCTDLVQSSMY